MDENKGSAAAIAWCGCCDGDVTVVVFRVVSGVRLVVFFRRLSAVSEREKRGRLWLVFRYCCFDRKLWRREGEGKEKGKGSGGVHRSFGCSSENGSGGDGERDEGRGTRLKV
ncbi:hypothetical protein HAX54_015577 [Datura stramonium]|uniref:Uncharacterized protein n=1 Tax=Datura stramonium TaxID=4076 RepID=A0ABS8RFX9_DATST|nr:hypothetical protein [Datura stramonium]